MYVDHLFTVLSIIGLTSALFYGGYQLSRYAFLINNLLLFALAYFLKTSDNLVLVLLNVVCPLLLINTALYVFLHKKEVPKNGDNKYQVDFATTKGNFKLDNFKRGASCKHRSKWSPDTGIKWSGLPIENGQVYRLKLCRSAD